MVLDYSGVESKEEKYRLLMQCSDNTTEKRKKWGACQVVA